jgi:hypothetical protein
LLIAGSDKGIKHARPEDPETRQTAGVTEENEPVQKQPANDRPVEGHGIRKDERAQEQPADKKRALQNK